MIVYEFHGTGTSYLASTRYKGIYLRIARFGSRDTCTTAVEIVLRSYGRVRSTAGLR